MRRHEWALLFYPDGKKSASPEELANPAASGASDYCALFVALIGEGPKPEGIVHCSGSGRWVRAFHRFTLVSARARRPRGWVWGAGPAAALRGWAGRGGRREAVALPVPLCAVVLWDMPTRIPRGGGGPPPRCLGLPPRYCGAPAFGARTRELAALPRPTRAETGLPPASMRLPLGPNAAASLLAVRLTFLFSLPKTIPPPPPPSVRRCSRWTSRDKGGT